MKLDTLFENFDLLMDASNAVPKMRDLILQLAVQGKLVEQEPTDEPAGELLKRIKAEKEKLIAEGKIKKQKLLTPITEDEIPYGIPESWTWIRLEEVFYPISVGKKKIKTSEISEEGPCPVIDQGQSYIAGYTNESDKLINIPGPVIIFGDHTCELKLINFDFVAGADGVKVLRPIEIYENYFFLVLKTLKIEERGYSRHYKYFLNNLLPLPSLAEQKRIVAKVDQLMQLCDQLDACQEKASIKYTSLNDAAMEKLLSAKTIDEFANHWQFVRNNFELIYNDPAHVNKLRQAILQLAVQGKLAPQDLNDEPAIELLKRIKTEKEKLIAEGKIKKQKPLPQIAEDEIPYELPQGWEWVRLDDICSYIQRGKGPKYVDNSEFPVVSQKCIQWHGFQIEKARFIDPASLDKYAKERFLQTGDLLWNSTGTGTIGRLCVYIHDDNPYDKVVADSHVTIARPIINSEYLFCFLANPTIQDGFEDRASGTTNQIELSTSTVKNQVIPLAPLTEQKRIVSKVDQLMHFCDELETRLNQSKKDSERLMQAVLYEAFS